MLEQASSNQENNLGIDSASSRQSHPKMTNGHAVARTTIPKSNKRSSSQNGGFLPVDQWEQGQRQQKIFPRSTMRFLVSIVFLVTLIRLTIETSMVRNYLFSTRNEQIHYQSGDLDSANDRRNHPLILSPSSSAKINQYSHDNVAYTRDPTTICSGSTFQSMPSATDLLLPSQTWNQQQRQHRCYETSQGDTFFDKSTEDHNYSDTNYVFHVLGGGRCSQNGFESLPRGTSRNIIVTAYYEIPSKHPPHKYRNWMGNFLSVYQDPIVIFTSPNLVGLLADLRRRNNNETANMCEDPPCSSVYFDTVLIALPLEELPLAKFYPKSFWVDQLDRDPQSDIHSPLRGDPRMQGQFESGELYWIWLSKVWFVVETTRILGVNRDLNDPPTGHLNSDKFLRNNSNYDNKVFAWIDIGSFRNEDPIAKNESDPPFLLQHPEVVPISEMLFWSHSSAHSSKLLEPASGKNSVQNYAPIAPRISPYFDDKSLGGGRYFFHSGAHFAGRPRSIARFYRQFLQTMDVFVERNLTLADDQAVMQSSCLSFFYENRRDEYNNQREREFDKQPDNLCVYAIRDMVGGKSKWFGLAKLLQVGWANTGQTTHDLYWKPPPHEYYLERSKESIGGKDGCRQRSSSD